MTATDLIAAANKLSRPFRLEIRASLAYGGGQDVTVAAKLYGASGSVVATATEIVAEGEIATADAAQIVAALDKACRAQLKRTKAAIKRERATT